MPSPFPGMNPYFENPDPWPDFHHEFISQARHELDRQLGEKYIAKVEIRLYLHELSAEERRFFGVGDVGMSTERREPASQRGMAGATAPQRLTLPAFEEERQARIEIVESNHRRVVTVIELLSPTNKTPGPDRDSYLQKRMVLLKNPTHFVEIDLRRGGARPHPPELPRCDYYCLVSRYEDRPEVEFWPIGLRERLPVIPIPLAAPDPDVVLDLQEIVNRVYDAASYRRYIYRNVPEPRLSTDDEIWAQQFIPGPT